ncbi:MAG: DUF4070 domain-containing protein [Patescibacteria group bacterium]|nr:DUF4070 domain-containing protein [Patescibacteria group bacterium]
MPNPNLKILLIYPKYPDTFWSFKHALKFISKKAVHPPLGLLTVAAMLPASWQKKVIDLNVQKLKDKHLEWADYIFISAMGVQRESVKKIVGVCKIHHKKIVAGGPLFTACPEEFEDIDYLVLNEAEITLPIFLKDLENNCARHIYSTAEFPSIENTPVPLFELINIQKYASLNLQYSRGCPFNCEFCDITTLFGRAVRTKTKFQILVELQKIYDSGWRGNVFFVDDNFIGNKNKLKEDVLPAIAAWMKQKKYPFAFMTEASINLADDEELMTMMVDAGFNSVFVGIETPDENSLAECNKHQNINRDLVESVKKIQNFGLEVAGGFIVGFDNDQASIFQKQIDFIKKSGIITAMVGLLNVPKNTGIYHRLKKENRLIKDFTGNNTDLSLNFIPKMDSAKLIEGYQKILKEIYAIKPYYERIKNFLKNYQPPKKLRLHFNFGHFGAFLKSIWFLGLKEKGRRKYWGLFFWSLFKRPQLFPMAITFAIYGYHFRTIFEIV